MRARDSSGAPARLARSRELLLLDRLSGAGRAAALTLAVALAACWGFAALALHEQALTARAGGTRLSPLAAIFADGSSMLTAWPGWLAAALLGLSAARLRGGPVEPPAGRGTAPELSVGEVRSGLRREYLAARLILIVVGVVALADLARLAITGIAALVGVGGAGDGLAWMGVEVAGLGAASAALALWVLSFRRQLERVGALKPGHPRGSASPPPT